MSDSASPAAVDDRKRALRREVRVRLRALPVDESARAGRMAAEQLAAFLASQVPPGPVALFASRPFEIDTRPLDDAVRAAGRVRLLPAIADDHLVFRAVPLDVRAADLPLDRFDIPTPQPSAPVVPLLAAALVVVPACAVDGFGRRLGWGKGYYDRALAPRCADGRARGTIALVLDVQLVSEVPVGPGDALIERLWTPANGLTLVP
ncbi:MAG: 5-formyltetrahydrofolate cyclo-ligase [Deltaproteobacteria bacterium]|nr:5-formyltetrahydrofolate cyclo-ligase [Deltaproteobacteria bacterium]